MLYKFRWVFPGINGSVCGFTFWTVCTARTGQFKAVDPQYEQTIRGTQAWFYQSSGTTGEDDVGSTVATQWPMSMQYEVAFGFGLTALRSQALTKK